jgi:hypothetical protein
MGSRVVATASVDTSQTSRSHAVPTAIDSALRSASCLSVAAVSVSCPSAAVELPFLAVAAEEHSPRRIW